jgi:nitroreductase
MYLFNRQGLGALIKSYKKMFKVNRMPDYPVHELIINRVSSRAFSQEPMTQGELMSLFEAARWAQSSYNEQPWRLIYAQRDTPAWSTFLSLLVPFNLMWAQHASYLVLVISKNNLEKTGKLNKPHSFDTGAALENMSLQGTAMGIIVHGMSGFDYDRAKSMLNIPDDYTIEALFAVGKRGSSENLSPELQEREKPSSRKKIAEFVFKDTFGKHISED